MSFFSPKPKLPVEEPPKKVPLPMPNVFVVPPEEDQTPPWCFFHAENPELSQIDEQSETLDNSVLFEVNGNSPPTVFSTEAMMQPTPGRNFETVSIVDALLSNREDGNDSGSETSFEGEMDVEEDEKDDANSIQENNRHEPSRDQEREPADDSDVIEIVKVSRRKSLAEDRRDNQSVRAFSEFKRSGTLKSRASKVFRSLRGTLRSKPRAQDIFPSSAGPTRRASQKAREPEPSERETMPRPRTPTISRRGSGVLTQLFTAPSIKPRSSISSFNERTLMSEEAEMPHSPPASPQSSHFGSVLLSRRTSLYTLGKQQDEIRLRAASPTPTTVSSKTTNRRRSFSIMRLFSFSSSSSSNTTSMAPTSSMQSASTPYDDSGRATPTQHSNSSTPSATSSISTVSSPQPQTPTSTEATPVRLVTKDESIEPPMFGNFDSIFDTNAGLNLGLGLSLDDPNESSMSSRHTILRKGEQASDEGLSRTGRQSREDPEDTSLEMRLDSFRFDDLSFDANRF